MVQNIFPITLNLLCSLLYKSFGLIVSRTLEWGVGTVFVMCLSTPKLDAVAFYMQALNRLSPACAEKAISYNTGPSWKTGVFQTKRDSLKLPSRQHCRKTTPPHLWSRL